MERRRSRRVKFSLKAERISGSGDRTVFIENISEEGILMVLPHSKKAEKFQPGMIVDLRFRLSSGKDIDLTCIVRWAVQKMPPDGKTDSVGLEIEKPPVLYQKFVRTISSGLNTATDPAF